MGIMIYKVYFEKYYSDCLKAFWENMSKECLYFIMVFRTKVWTHRMITYTEC
jgi:hypothetical protein